MTRPLTRATPTEAADWRAEVDAMATRLRKKHAAKRSADTGPVFVTQKIICGDGMWTLQAPIIVQTAHAMWRQFSRSSDAKSQIDRVLALLRTNLRAMSSDDEARARITAIELVRLSPGELSKHDGIRSAFEHVLDAVCAWVVLGNREVPRDRRGRRTGIGKFDDRILDTGTYKTGRVTCSYSQQRCPENPRAQGIQIRLSVSTD